MNDSHRNANNVPDSTYESFPNIPTLREGATAAYVWLGNTAPRYPGPLYDGVTVPDVIARIDIGRCCLCKGDRNISFSDFRDLGAAATYNLFLERPGADLSREVVPCPLCGMFSPFTP